MTRQLCNAAASGSRERPQNNAGLSGSVIDQLEKKGAYLHHAPFTLNMLADSPKLELQDHVETQGPLLLRAVLSERLTVVQRPIVANFRADQ